MSSLPNPLLCILLLAVTACGTEPADPANDAAVQAAPETNSAVAELPTIDPPLSRRDILREVAGAASDFAAGTQPETAQRALDGRQFSFRIRHCGENDSRFVTSFNTETRVYKVIASPGISGSDAAVSPLVAGGQFEDAEGFWVPRPWLLQAACPVGPAQTPTEPVDPSREADEPAAPQPVTANPPTVGLVDFHTQDRTRAAQRKNRPYEVTRILPGGVEPGPLDLVIEGRLRRLPVGGVIHCSGDALNGPPVCLVSVRIDRVRMEGASGDVLGEWTKR